MKTFQRNGCLYKKKKDVIVLRLGWANGNIAELKTLKQMSLLKCSAAGSNAWIRALCIKIKCKLKSHNNLVLYSHSSFSMESHAHGVVRLALVGGQHKVGMSVCKCVWPTTGPAVVWRLFSWPTGGMCTVNNLSGGPALIWPLERQNGVRRLMGRSLLSLLFIFHVPTSQGGSEEELKTLGGKNPPINNARSLFNQSVIV